MRRIKNRKKEWIFASLLLFAVCLILPLTAQAKDEEDYYTEYTDSETGYTAILYDEADVLNQKSERLILEDLTELTKYGNAVFYSAVADSYANESKAQRMARNYYEGCFSSTSNGVIVAIILDSDEQGGCMLWVETYNKLNKTVTTSQCTDIADNAVATTRKHASGKYYGYDGTRNYFGYADEALLQVQKVLDGKNIPAPMKIITSALLAMVLGLLINFMIVAGFNRKKTPKEKEVLAGLISQFHFTDTKSTLIHIDKRYSPRSSSSGGGGGGGGGGGHSGGGGHRG